MKPDELALLMEISRIGPLPGNHRGVNVRDIIKSLGMNWKRAAGILEKWTRKGWYNYGVCVDLGWLEQPGVDKAQEFEAIVDRHASDLKNKIAAPWN